MPQAAFHRLDIRDCDCRLRDHDTFMVAFALGPDFRLRLWLGRSCILREEYSHNFDVSAVQLLCLLGHGPGYFHQTLEILELACLRPRTTLACMGRAFGFILVLIVVATGGYIYTRQAKVVTSAGSNPQTTVEVTGV